MPLVHHVTGSVIESSDDKLKARSGSSLTKFTIILDLDATIISTIEPRNPNELSMMEPGNLKRTIGADNYYEFDLGTRSEDKIWGVIRPNTVKFLEFCDKYFDRVIVYTAGTQDYGHAIVSAVFSRTRTSYRPDYILTRPECLMLDDDMIAVKGVRKPLKMMIPNYDPTKCVLIDDRMSNIRFNPRNGIIIPPFNPRTITEVHEDRCLQLLQDWFSQQKTILTPDIRDLEKMLIFVDECDLEADYF